MRSRHISVRVSPSPRHRFLYGQADYVITTGESVEGPLKGTRLEQRVGIMSFRKAWMNFHPDSRDVEFAPKDG